MATQNVSLIKTKTRKIDGLSIRYAESPLREESAILLSPWPESLYTFEQMWSRLAEHAHLVAIDLPGFGHSERRDDLLQPSDMAEFVVHVINDFGLERPHAVGPDIGTSTLLFAAAKHPSLLRSIVLGNGTAAVPIQVGGVLNDIVGARDIEPFRKIDPRQGVDSVLAFVERYKLPEHVREDFLSAYEGDRFVESLRFLQAYKTEVPKLGTLLPTIMTPVEIITGDHDPGVLPINGDYLHERLPHNKYDKINAGHFPWADVADEYAGLIIDWWKGGYERVSGGKASVATAQETSCQPGARDCAVLAEFGSGGLVGFAVDFEEQMNRANANEGDEYDCGYQSPRQQDRSRG